MTRKNRVFIVHPFFGVDRMFHAMPDWEIVPDIRQADLVQFTGGQDINPALYGEKPHPKTYFSDERDRKEIIAFYMAKQLGLPMAGICRGGQLLNVLCGGKMWQDVNGHMGDHIAYDTKTGKEHMVTSIHHQMMMPGPGSLTILVALESTRKDWVVAGEVKSVVSRKPLRDVEALVYDDRKVFCFQGHPEIGDTPLIKLYFDYLGYHLNVNFSYKG